MCLRPGGDACVLSAVERAGYARRRAVPGGRGAAMLHCAINGYLLHSCVQGFQALSRIRAGISAFATTRCGIANRFNDLSILARISLCNKLLEDFNPAL